MFEPLRTTKWEIKFIDQIGVIDKPKPKIPVVTWEIGFCASVTSYLNEYIKEKETTI